MMKYLAVCLAALCAYGSCDGAPVSGDSECPPSKEWNIMKLTQSWPPAVCIYLENEDRKCEISSKINSWVIHGLWPTKTGTECPNYCNETWKFDESKVEVLRPRLDFNWPSIEFDEKPEESWKHEWEKHGTCGVSLSAIKDEVHYFNYTLGLHDHFNISLFLLKSGINPTMERAYKAEDILTALTQAIGSAPSLTCVKEKKSEKYYLEQVEICLDKSFKPTDCLPNLKDNLTDLLFRPEAWLFDGNVDKKLFRSNINGCGKESDVVYYKPMPRNKSTIQV